MTDTLMAARARIREAATAEIPAFQRVDRLGEIKRELEEALVEVDDAIADAVLSSDEDGLNRSLAVLALRSRATATAELVSAGRMTEQQLAESGVLSHDDLDALEQEGLLEAAAEEMVHAGALRPSSVLAGDASSDVIEALAAPENEQSLQP